MEHKKGELYIGRLSDTGEPLTIKADNLTTHGVIVGMTGSGKTGLGVNILEEALLSDIPTLIIDPKGDMGNLLLNFPDHDPAEFEPWVDEAKATRKGVTLAELAATTAANRQAQLLEHDTSPDRMRQLKENSEITIYTPGSAAGVGLNILGSLKATDLDWAKDAEIIRDEIEGFVSSLLLLAGVESDPVSGPEHILLATIVETTWKAGKDLDLAGLIGQIPKPPFRKLGVFDVDTFFPAKKRMNLALKLNGLLASPSFAAWMEGEPLDIEALIGRGDKTKCAVIYMAHLTESERQFVVTLLLSKLVTWIRAQPGSSELRALVYMDEAFGYVPPTAEPPSKKPIMTILKQARAFGVGMLLVTQNPVDLDYKAMSNAGTWIVGRLQTENDKRRILEGMQRIDEAGVSINLDALISNLEKRQFILHSAKKSKPKLFKRRRSMSFRIGPLTRDQVANLMGDKRPTPAPAPVPEVVLDPATTGDDDTVPVAPSVAEGVAVRYLDPGTPWAGEIGADPTGTRFEAAAAATVQLLYDDTRAGVRHTETYEGIIFPLDGLVDARDVVAVDHDDRDFGAEPPEGATYATGDVKLQNKTFWTGLESDLKTHLVANRQVQVFHNTDLKLYSRVGESEDEFTARCKAAADDAADAAMAKLVDRYKTKIDRVKGQISTADARARELEGDASAKQQEELMSGAGDLLGALLGGSKRSNPLGKAASRRAASQKARARAEAAADKLTAKQVELADLEDELSNAIVEITDEFADLADSFETVDIGLEKTDIRVADIKLVWVPR
ncbi:MAG: DUF87 domain-containing protein [Actinomycetota bacterium]|nr:DUF87 domain-containing protein [Actinomycetota bacterium]